MKSKIEENQRKQQEKAKAKEEAMARKAAEKEARQAQKIARKNSVEKVKAAKVSTISPEELAERKKNIQERTQMIWPIFSEKFDRKTLRQEVKVELNKNLPVQETIKRLLQADSQAQ